MLKNTLYIFCLFFIFSCKSNDDIENLSVSEYPSTIGSKWEYTRISTITNNDEEELDEETSRFFQEFNEAMSGYSYEEIVRKELVDGIETVVFEKFSKSENSEEGTSYTYNYYQENDSYLYLENENSKHTHYKFPLSVGDSWFQIKKGDWEIINKTVVGTEEVTVPAGTFNCFKIHVEHSIGSDIFNSYEYIANIGVVKVEEINYHLLRDNYGNPITKSKSLITIKKELSDYIIK